MLFLNVFKGTIWNRFILSIDYYYFFGSVNRLPHYLVSLKLNILFVYLKQVMGNYCHFEAGSVHLKVKITLIL